MHLNQVHKETLHQVENALPNRQGLDVEIFGMEGIPHEILDQHRNRIIQNFYQAQEDRRIATGNPLPGQTGQNTRKKIKMETKEELLTRLREWRAMKKTEKEAVAKGVQDGAVPGNAPPPQLVCLTLAPLTRGPAMADMKKHCSHNSRSWSSSPAIPASPRTASLPTHTQPTHCPRGSRAVWDLHLACRNGRLKAWPVRKPLVVRETILTR